MRERNPLLVCPIIPLRFASSNAATKTPKTTKIISSYSCSTWRRRQRWNLCHIFVLSNMMISLFNLLSLAHECWRLNNFVFLFVWGKEWKKEYVRLAMCEKRHRERGCVCMKKNEEEWTIINVFQNSWEEVWLRNWDFLCVREREIA